MARVHAGVLNISGKLGDKIITREGKHHSHIRSVVKPGTKKDEAALRVQYSRTAILNKLAGQVNNVVNSLAGSLKIGRFYRDVQGLLRKEPSNNRLLLLHKLKGLEAHPRYTLLKHGLPVWTVKMEKKRLMVNLRVQQHPLHGMNGSNCYSYEIALVCWDNTDDPVQYARQYSAWISTEGALPEFDFIFKKPEGAMQWILCLRIVLGKNGEPDGSFPADGMRIIEVGSFDKREQALLQAVGRPQTDTDEPAKKLKEVPRVKAKFPSASS